MVIFSLRVLLKIDIETTYTSKEFENIDFYYLESSPIQAIFIKQTHKKHSIKPSFSNKYIAFFYYIV